MWFVVNVWTLENSKNFSVLFIRVVKFMIIPKEKFQERIYQYEQDVNRGGTEPEIAAANRGLMIVDGSPVPEEVASCLKTIQSKKEC